MEARWRLITFAFVCSVLLVAQTINIPPSGAGLPFTQYLTRGATFTLGRMALVDGTGAISTVAGNATDCVHVDGSSGPCGAGSAGSTPTFVDGEIPSGNIDGANTTFVLAFAPNPSTSLLLWLNGLYMKQGLDYTIAGSTITFYSTSTPQVGETLVASYRR